MLVRIPGIKRACTHTQMDFFEAVCSEMSRNLNHMNASCYINIANSFFFSVGTHCHFQALLCLMAHFPL